MEAATPQQPLVSASAATGAERAPEPQRLPKGTPFDPAAATLSVVTYNLLAPAFVRSIDTRTSEVQDFAKFAWAEPAAEVLDWEVRRPRLLAELQACLADIICLQEVQFEKDEGVFKLPAWLDIEGYAPFIPKQGALQHMAERNLRVLNQEAAIGCALLHRTDRLERLLDRGVGALTTLVPLCLRGREGSALAALGPFVVFSAHLDAKSEHKRVETLCKCLASMRQMRARTALIAGDMNTECFSGSCIAAMLAGARRPKDEDMARECARALRLSVAEGEDLTDPAHAEAEAATSEQLREWSELWSKAAEAASVHRVSLSHVPTGPTRAGYDHGKDCGPCVSWRLDHIFYTGRALELLSCWTALDADPEAVAQGLPNRTCPSDHLPVAACFRLLPELQLDEAERAALFGRADELDARQQAEGAALRSELEATKPKEPQDAAEVVAVPVEGAAGQKKAKKRKAERPSAEMQAHIRDCRQRSRGQQEAHAQERAEFVASLSELEHDAFEQRLRGATPPREVEAWSSGSGQRAPP